MSDIKRIAVYGRKFADEDLPVVSAFLNRLAERNAALIIYAPFHNYLKARMVLPANASVFAEHQLVDTGAGLVISLGGDGTIVETAAMAAPIAMPILGVNTGRLGFLASMSVSELLHRTEDILKGNYSIEERTMLKVETGSQLFGSNNFALNELTVHRKDTTSMIAVHTYLNDEFLNTYWADGLILSTPTGSTAYSMSCGGPIILPGSHNFVITPVAPHNLSSRPFVIPDNSVLRLKVEGRSKYFLLSLDSRIETIDASTELIVRKNEFPTRFAQLPGQTFIRTMSKKLNWGLDQRN
ncbi:MAG: NAD kinase [Flavobacteriales bacterium]|nr:NAD kinase [Flavobacteriales bacterium]